MPAFSIKKILALIAIAVFGLCYYSFGQLTNPYIKIVNIVVDSTKLEEFKAVLKKSIEASVFSEPGTITIYAVFDNANPSHVTVFEIYENVQAHQQTASFREYREATNNMAKSVERTEASSIALESKQVSNLKK